MAFTRATDLAKKIQAVVLPGVTVSVGNSQRIDGLEVVVRGFSHPEDGMSRVWTISLIGPSGLELDLVITALRKLGFEMRGEAPIMRGTLSEVLSAAERSRLKRKEEQLEAAAQKATERAELQAETYLVQQSADRQIEELKEQLEAMRQQLEDLTLLPQPRGPAGPAGEPGPAGRDGVDLVATEAELNDLQDVQLGGDIPLEAGQVLTWDGSSWANLYVPQLSGPISPGGGGGGSGGGGNGSISILQRNRDNPSAEPSYVQTEVTKISFDSDSGFEAEDLGDGEAFIKLNSTFNPWHVEGQETLDATGEEPVEFVAGEGVSITTDANSATKKIIFSALNNSDLEEAPEDGNFYIRRLGQWVKFNDALRAFGVPFFEPVDAGNFTTGRSAAITSRGYDAGNSTSGRTEASDSVNLDGGRVS